MQLENRFKYTAALFSDNAVLVDTLWNEVHDNYTSKNRFYHNLSHLENLIQELTPIQNQFKDWEVVLFSVFYHDIIYKSTKKDNEEQSGKLAVERLRTLALDENRINSCFHQIIATKSHIATGDSDTDLFTDADLSILGKDWETYQTYFQNIRKEYKTYPNPLYNPARKKALSHFLEMPSIFKTPYFKDLYEQQAIANISKEIDLL